MKRVYIILIFSVLVLAVNAQNYFGVSLGLLTTYQLDNVDNTTARLGGGGEIGAIYQLQRNNFLFQTGLGLNYSVSILGVDSMPLSANMIDTEGATFTYKGIVYEETDFKFVFSFNNVYFNECCQFCCRHYVFNQSCL